MAINDKLKIPMNSSNYNVIYIYIYIVHLKPVNVIRIIITIGGVQMRVAFLE